jgi:hypothetical protein
MAARVIDFWQALGSLFVRKSRRREGVLNCLFALLHFSRCLVYDLVSSKEKLFRGAGPSSGLAKTPIVLLGLEPGLSLCLELMYGYAALREQWGREKSD